MAWREARALVQLKAELDLEWPGRDRASDGAIGDAAHQAEGSASDHNPWVIDAAGIGVVTARDVDTDVRGLADDPEIMLAILEHIANDPRVKYVIFDRRINYGDGWVPYRGVDPHTSHAHISVKSTPGHYDDTTPWGIAPTVAGIGSALTQTEDTEDMAKFRTMDKGGYYVAYNYAGLFTHLRNMDVVRAAWQDPDFVGPHQPVDEGTFVLRQAFAENSRDGSNYESGVAGDPHSVGGA